MVFKKMLSKLGVGGPSVDTILDTPRVVPGGAVRGTVHIEGGEVDVDIDYVTLGLTTRIESESGDSEYRFSQEFTRFEAARGFHLPAKTRQAIPFEFPVPWETPVTEIYGQHLRGMSMGVRTELAVAKAVDKGDLDPIAISPLPSQLVVMEVMENLGFRFKAADLEMGRLYGVQQTLPFFQEIEFYAPQGGINEIELTFVASPTTLDVILEADKRGGFFTPGGDLYHRLRLSHNSVDRDAVAGEIQSWLARAGAYSGGHGGGHGQSRRRHGHSGHHGAIGGAAAGLLGGMMLGGMMGEDD